MGIAKIGGVTNAAVADTTIAGTAGESLSQYDVCYLHEDGKYYKTRSDLLTDGSQEPATAMAAAAISAEASGSLWTSGARVTNPAWALTIGQQVYASLYPGEISQVIPANLIALAMTGNSAPSPLVASADTAASGHEAYKAFDGDTATYWAPSSGETGVLKLDFGMGRTIQYYSLTAAPLTEVDIAGLSRANPCVVTWTGHGLSTNDYVRFSGITQDAEWGTLNNDSYQITWIDANSFSVAVDTSGYAGAYVPATDPGTYAKRSDPTAWTLAGSNNDSDWTELDTESGETALINGARSYFITSPASYRYYRLTISGALSDIVALGELEFTLMENYLQVLGIALSATSIDFRPNSLEIGVA